MAKHEKDDRFCKIHSEKVLKQQQQQTLETGQNLIFGVMSHYYCCCSVTESCPTLQLLAWQHIRLSCPSPSPGVCSNACKLSQWCYLTISSSVAPFSFCPLSFPISGSFPISHYIILNVMKKGGGSSLVVQWLSPRALNAGGTGSIPGQGTKIAEASQCWPNK